MMLLRGPVLTIRNNCSSSSSCRSLSTASSSSILFPSARHLAESQGKDATGLIGSGKGGRVTKSDVKANLASLPALAKKQSTTPVAAVLLVGAAAVPATATAVTTAPFQAPISTTRTISTTPIEGNPYEDVPNSKMRKIIAKRLTESKQQVPHCYASIQVELDNMMALRKQFQSLTEQKVSVNDFVLKCSGMALRDVPTVNGRHPTIDISVAVATPTGLITPIVFGIDMLGLAAVAATVRDLGARARDGKLAPHEYQGGSFSVSNLGMFGVNQFSAVINPPQAAILAVGGGTPTLRPSAPGDSDSGITTKSVMTARLSFDRRVVDEKSAAMFLQAFRHYMQSPELMLL
jgi:pyruvate dehydrogenase E2 component (dihydrolipoamide acetyltransferase)